MEGDGSNQQENQPYVSRGSNLDNLGKRTKYDSGAFQAIKREEPPINKEDRLSRTQPMDPVNPNEPKPRTGLFRRFRK